jgi:hypothetical protein
MKKLNCKQMAEIKGGMFLPLSLETINKIVTGLIVDKVVKALSVIKY